MPIFLPVLLPIAVIAVPFLDLLLAVVRRTRAGRSPFAPDKQHLHHRLLLLGHSQTRAVLLMYAITAVIRVRSVALALVSAMWAAALRRRCDRADDRGRLAPSQAGGAGQLTRCSASRSCQPNEADSTEARCPFRDSDDLAGLDQHGGRADIWELADPASAPGIPARRFLGHRSFET